jgi:hypothetical protein
MRGGLRQWALDTVASQSFQESSIWNGKAARLMLENALNGQGSVNAIWPVMNAYVLQKTFKETASRVR